MLTNAKISSCGGYRFELSRFWGGHPLLVYIMLNPSTADASVDDPTIRRCISFARRERAGGILVVNLSPQRVTNPRDLGRVPLEVSQRNLDSIAWASSQGRVVCAWGVTPKLLREEAATVVMSLIGKTWCLGTTKDGHPRHPLYVRADAPLRVWP